MSILGTSTFLLTDFEETFIVDTEFEFSDLLELGYFSGDDPAAYAFLKLNPIVNRVLGCLKRPIHLESHGRGYEALRKARQPGKAQSAGEVRVLEALRSNRFESVEVKLINGKLKTLKATERLRADSVQDIAKVVENGQFQSVTVKQQDGSIVGFERTLTSKLDK
jgi:hypothetical protein